MERAWERERRLRLGARPPEGQASDWSGVGDVLKARKALLAMLWRSEVPGSRAPEEAFVGMVQAWPDRGFDVRAAEAELEAGFAALEAGPHGELELRSARLPARLAAAPRGGAHPPPARAAPCTASPPTPCAARCLL